MIGKRILAAFIFVLLLCSCIGVLLPVNAEEEDWSAAIVIEKIDETDREITVRVSVEKITCKSGIFCAVYEIHYDNSVLELISWENSKPDGWNFSNEVAEDWTGIRQTEGNSPETYLAYTLLNSATSGGVKKDGVLYTDLRFKLLSDTADSATISVTDIQLAEVTLLNPCHLPNQRREIGLNGNADSPIISGSEESSSAGEVSSDDPSTSQAESSEEQPNSSDPAQSAGEETPPTADEPSETAKKVRMWITVEDITDPAGVSSLYFQLQYNTSVFRFVRYECLLPSDWDLKTEFTEDLTKIDPKKGNQTFWVVNHEVGHGVKTGGVLGFLVEFTFNGENFDSSLFTIDDVQVISDDVKEMTIDSYRLSFRYEVDGEMLPEDDFSSNANEGKILKICIAVISVVVIAAAAVTVFLILRKRKLA